MDEIIATRDVFLEPARVMVNKEPALITTVVGSAVAVTIWDNVMHFGGMCHFIYPEINEKDKTTVEYGNVAIYVLIKTMNEFGSNVKNLEAQVFGGAKPLEEIEGKYTRGHENLESAYKALHKYKIRVISEDTGGNVGRKIAFNTMKNEVVTYKVKKLRKDDWHYM